MESMKQYPIPKEEVTLGRMGTKKYFLFFREINFKKISWNWFHQKKRKKILLRCRIALLVCEPASENKLCSTTFLQNIKSLKSCRR